MKGAKDSEGWWEESRPGRSHPAHDSPCPAAALEGLGCPDIGRTSPDGRAGNGGRLRTPRSPPGPPDPRDAVGFHAAVGDPAVSALPGGERRREPNRVAKRRFIEPGEK